MNPGDIVYHKLNNMKILLISKSTNYIDKWNCIYEKEGILVENVFNEIELKENYCG